MIRIKEFIESCFEENHRMPTVREIAAEMNVAPSCVHRYLIEMDERGMISYSNGRMSTEKIDKMNFQTNNAALVGSIPCGVPDMREAHVEDYMPLPVSIFGSDELYIRNRSKSDNAIDFIRIFVYNIGKADDERNDIDAYLRTNNKGL